MAKQLHWVLVSIVFVVRCFLCVHSNIIVINIGPDLCVVDVFIVIFGGQFRHVVCCNSLPTACPLFLTYTGFKIRNIPTLFFSGSWSKFFAAVDRV